MDELATKVLEQGTLLALGVAAIIGAVRWGVPRMLDNFNDQIERERGFAHQIMEAQQEHHDAQLAKVVAHAEAQHAATIMEWQHTREDISKKTDSWKEGLNSLDGSVTKFTETMQREMVTNREELAKVYTRALDAALRHGVPTDPKVPGT